MQQGENLQSNTIYDFYFWEVEKRCFMHRCLYFRYELTISRADWGNERTFWEKNVNVEKALVTWKPSEVLEFPHCQSLSSINILWLLSGGRIKHKSPAYFYYSYYFATATIHPETIEPVIKS